MSRPATCHHDEGTTFHPAEPDVGIAIAYYQCDACDACSDDFEPWVDVEDTGDGWTTASSGVEITWPDCDCAECDPLQPDDDEEGDEDD